MKSSAGILCALFAMLIFPFWAEAETSQSVAKEMSVDSVILFRFVPGRQMFYSPFGENERSIRRVESLIGRYKESIVDGKACLVVHGYCSSFRDARQNRLAAKNRSNQVKSYFITFCGLKECHYRTRNFMHGYGEMKEVVVMGLEFMDEGQTEDKVRIQERPARDSSVLSALEFPACLLPVPVQSLEVADVRRLPVQSVMPEERKRKASPWYVKSNLLYDGILMPSLEVEYCFNDRWSAALEANYAWWRNSEKYKFYQIVTFVPEVRRWFNQRETRRGHYVGAFVGSGWYDLENGGEGFRGEGVMSGISYGYMFPVGRWFAFEAGIGLGYMYTWYKRYLPMDGHYAFQSSERLGYFGPLKLKFAWVWNIPFFKGRKGGGR